MRNGAKTRGFTLIEILLVVFLIALMAITAITSYMNSTTTFKFLSSYQQVVSALRTERSYALSNKQMGGVMPKRYGVCISQNNFLTFADTGQKDFKIDLLSSSSADISLLGGCNAASTYAVNASGSQQDSILRDKTATIGVSTSSGYAISATDSKATPVAIATPILIFYESGSGNLTAIGADGAKISKADVPYLNIQFAQNSGSLKRYIRIYQVSGLVEESTTP